MKNELPNVERISRTPVWLRVDENKGWPDWLSPVKRWSFTQPSKWGGPHSFTPPPSALSHRPRRMPKGQVGDCLPPVRVTLSKVHKWKTNHLFPIAFSSPNSVLPKFWSHLWTGNHAQGVDRSVLLCLLGVEICLGSSIPPSLLSGSWDSTAGWSCTFHKAHWFQGVRETEQHSEKIPVLYSRATKLVGKSLNPEGTCLI